MPSRSRSKATTQPQVIHQASSRLSPVNHRVNLTLVANTCRRKLGTEAGRDDHLLRRLVGHANMLDHLMEDLIEEERRQERRVCALLRANPKPRRQPKVQWIDTITEEIEEAQETDSDSDSDDEDHLEDSPNFKSCRAKSPPPKRLNQYFVGGEESSDDDTTASDEDQEKGLHLRRWPSNTNVPQLTYDAESESEDEESPERLPSSFAKRCTISAPKLQRHDKHKGLPARVEVVVH